VTVPAKASDQRACTADVGRGKIHTTKGGKDKRVRKYKPEKENRRCVVAARPHDQLIEGSELNQKKGLVLPDGIIARSPVDSRGRATHLRNRSRGEGRTRGARCPRARKANPVLHRSAAAIG